jgi:NnrS protein/uncharacterized protein DUF1858
MTSLEIKADMSVREVIARYPASVAVFERHGLMGCGGEAGPLEPLGFFARAHHVDPQQLISELKAVVHGSDVAAPAPPVSQAPDAQATRYVPFFLASLLLALTFGATLGALLLASMTLPWAAVPTKLLDAAKLAHGYAQVFGFTALFIMGVAYHAIPRLKGASLAAPYLVAVSFWLQVGGVLIVTIGMMAGPPIAPFARFAGTAALIGAALAFAWSMRQTLAANDPSPEGFEAYLLAGCVWLVAATGLALAAASGVGALQQVVWEAALYGFAGSWLLGMSLRVLPVFLGLRQARGRGLATFAAYQTATLLWVVVGAISQWRAVPVERGAAGVLLAAAATAFMWRLGIFGAREQAHGTDRGYEKFILTAYGWFALGLLCTSGGTALSALRGEPAPALLLDFGRHAFTLGFLTQMIIGISTRIVPVFTGRSLWSPAWREATFYLLNAAVGARALEAVVELGGPLEVWPYIALSALFGLAAFVTFAVNVAMTMAPTAAPSKIDTPSPPAEATADALVADLLHIPGALDLLVRHGFAPLRNPVLRATLARTVTLRQACRMHHLDVEPLVAELRTLAARGSQVQHGSGA